MQFNVDCVWNGKTKFSICAMRTIYSSVLSYHPGLFAKIATSLVILILFSAAPLCGQDRQTEQEDNPIDGENAYSILKRICTLGPRISGSDAMQQQQRMLTEYFEKLGAKVELQSFEMRHPATFRDVTIGNLIVQFYPDRKERIMICTHYDTRPYPDRDPRNPRGRFIGANDGASGVGLLCELGRHVNNLDGEIGLDFVFFDAEEFIYDKNRDELFVGSTYFSEQYRKEPPEYRYREAVLIDMIGDKHLDLYYEKNSRSLAPKLTKEIWQIAGNLGIREFKPQTRHAVRDDHLPLNNIARIPTCDIIDFDYPTIKNRNIYWHTTEDTVDKCSADSLAKVGWVLHRWISKNIITNTK